MKSRHEGIGLPLHGLKEELLTLSVLGSGTCSCMCNTTWRLMNGRLTQTAVCCIWVFTIQPGMWNSMRWSQVATLLGFIPRN